MPKSVVIASWIIIIGAVVSVVPIVKKLTAPA